MITLKEYLKYQSDCELFEEHKNEIVEFNSQLVQKYPWLAIRKWEDSEDDFFGTYKIPDNYDYVFTWFDDIPRGWAISFGLDMCEEIQKDLEEHNFVDGFSPAQIKEKWGELRFYTNGIPKDSKVHKIIDKYTEMSQNICIHCGKPAEWISTGWISPYCNDCKEASTYGVFKRIEECPN